MKVIKQRYSDLLDLEREEKLTLIVNERPLDLITEFGLKRYYCGFYNAPLDGDDGFLRYCSGNGETVEEALLDYMEVLSGGTIIVNPGKKDRREIRIPW
jgi:hypothetical protein